MNKYEEIWKDIEGFEGLYQISNMARVKSLQRRINTTSNRVKCTAIVNERIMKPGISNGYYSLGLSNGKRYTRLLHRLMGIAFLPNPLCLPQINHKDGNKLNNSLDNLEWCTIHYNISHAFDTGLITKRPKGYGLGRKLPEQTKRKISEHHARPRSKVNEGLVLQIRSLYESGKGTRTICTHLKEKEGIIISLMGIRNIINRTSWTHI